MNLEAVKKREKILESGLETLVDSDFSKDIVFQGGGALHFIFGSPRYSSDLDFVDPKIAEDINSYMQRIQHTGQDYNINKVKKMPSGKGIRAKWGFQEGDPLVKIEIEERDAPEYHKSTSRYPLLVKEVQDIYADKIFANISRYSTRKGTGQFPFKPTDFFDLKYINETLGQGPVTKEKINKKAAAYELQDILTSENINSITTLITDENNHDFFRSTLKKTIAPDIYKLLKFDKKFFTEVADHFDQYK